MTENKEIKSKENVVKIKTKKDKKGTIKTFDKSKIAMQKTKNNIVEIKDKPKEQYKKEKEERNGTDYAVEKVNNQMENIPQNVKKIQRINQRGKNSIIQTKENIKRASQKVQYIKKKSHAQKVAKGMIKGSQKAPKTAKTTIKTIENSAKTAKNTAKVSIKASQIALQISKVVASKIVQATKVAVKTTASAIKAIVAGTKAIITAIVAGGWVVIAIILVMCIFGAILSVFNSGGNEDTAELWNYDIVAFAETQVGVTGGDPYWSWYGFEERVEWCACFVSYCADQVGYIENDKVPKFSVCTDGINWYKEKDMWYDREDYFVPNPGDIIFFDWIDKETKEQDGVSDHVGIVKKYDSNSDRVITIEGNSGDECKENSYARDNIQIMGYGSTRIKNLDEV